MIISRRFAASETLSPEAIRRWSHYAASMKFETPEDARDWMFRKMELQDRSGVNVYGPEKNRAIANAMPLYQSGKSWKIGKRVREDKRFKLSQLQVKRPTFEELDMVANSNTESDFEYAGVKWLKISDLMSGEQDVYSWGRELEYIKSLAYKIKTNGWIEAVIVGQFDNGYELWEGQHRVRAMKVLGFNTVPAFIVKILE